MENIRITERGDLEKVNAMLKEGRELSCVGRNSGGFILHFEDAPGKFKLRDIELDLVHHALTELYEIDSARSIVKKCLSKIDVIKSAVAKTESPKTIA